MPQRLQHVHRLCRSGEDIGDDIEEVQPKIDVSTNIAGSADAKPLGSMEDN